MRSHRSETLRRTCPPTVDAVIGRATAKDAERPVPRRHEVAAELRAALEGDAASSPRRPGTIRNPYKGLRAFLEADAVDFFGREAVTTRLIRSLAEDDPAARFLAVVGPSGSGKSSVVRAGLVPALRRGAIPGSERWYVIELLPGRHPFRELETALLGVAVEPPPSLLEELEADELGIVRAVERVLPDPDAELLIVLDQLEELFTMIEDEVERTRFLAGLRAAALEPDSRVRVVATLRADFYDAPLSVPRLRRPARRPDRGDHADVTGGARAGDRRHRPIRRARRRAAAARRDDRRRRRSAGRAPAAPVRAHRARRARRRRRSPSRPIGASAGCPARSRGAPSSCSSR